MTFHPVFAFDRAIVREPARSVVVLLGAAFTGTAALLEEKGYRVVRLPTSEIAKVDAGLSCMSLRWRAG
jgi:N-dimethylarginine dimethylaminohydrolase